MASRRATRSEATPSKRPRGYFRIINLAKYDNDEAQGSEPRCRRSTRKQNGWGTNDIPFDFA